MPIVLITEFVCDHPQCPLVLKTAIAPGIRLFPFQCTLSLKQIPMPGWTLAPDGRVFCPEHEPKRIVGARMVPDLGALRGIPGGKP